MSSDLSYTLLSRLDRNPGLVGLEELEPLPEGRFLGIVGLMLERPSWDVAKALRLDPIIPRIGSHEITRVVKDPRIAAIVARYVPYIGYELSVSPDLAVGDEAIGLGRDFISLLRVRAVPEILVPAVLGCSWSASTLNRRPAHSCDAELLEDIPNLLQLDDPRPVSVADLDWIFQNLSAFQLLLKTSPAYGLAVDSLCQHTQQTSMRMAAAMLWSGIEALFPVRGEITYRLAMYIAAVLDDPGPSRYQTFRLMKQEYNTRSRIVHGDATDFQTIRHHILTTRRVLSQLLCWVTENNGLLSPDELDGRLLSPSARELAQADNKMIAEAME
jgi:hypothetical protein